MQSSTRAFRAAVETTVRDRTPPASDEPLPRAPRVVRQRRVDLKSLLERERYISPLQRSVIKNKAETTHSCIAVGEKGKAVWPGADWDVRWCWWLATHDGRFESPPRAWLRVYLPDSERSTERFLFNATLITPFLSPHFTAQTTCVYELLCRTVQRGKLICSKIFDVRSNSTGYRFMFIDNAKSITLTLIRH